MVDEEMIVWKSEVTTLHDFWVITVLNSMTVLQVGNTQALVVVRIFRLVIVLGGHARSLAKAVFHHLLPDTFRFLTLGSSSEASFVFAYH